MKKAILTVGPSCCGKSTYARSLKDFFYLERDEIRFWLFTNGKRNWRQYKFNRKNESRVSKEHKNRLDEIIINNKNIVLSDTWLNEKYRREMVEYLESKDYGVSIYDQWPDLSWDELRARNIQRAGGIAEHILWRQWQLWLDYKKVARYNPDLRKPSAFICDIDGTVAAHENRSPHDFSKVLHDYPIPCVIKMVQGLIDRRQQCIFFSGRSEECKSDTKLWLNRYIGPEYFSKCLLYMREKDDHRRDSIVKKEMFWKYAGDKYNVIMAIDDRNQVVRETWSELGIKCIHVGHMYEEF